ncbi:response regulator [Sphingomonas colocasiae]|uniref:Response regulator n=1 Tax=Sphingomonas colocasiae TaxID=1848973 RepID=A0ABS7PVF4_9SPHN|nr:response regulator [Sphingomonas colocasiae]MBY8825183.1 response regulator [Sphingomonas colocasiae]
MSALIIEDDDFKVDRMTGFLQTEAPQLSVEIARSYKTGLRALVAKPRTLVLLDMTLPTFDVQRGSDGGRPLSLGGRELLRQMKRRGATWPVVVVTGFDTFGTGPSHLTLEQLDTELRREFDSFYLGSVYFSATSDTWRDQLRVLADGALTGPAS